MLHLVLTLQLLGNAPPSDAQRLSLQVPDETRARTENSTRMGEHLGGAGGVAVAQGVSVGLGAGAEMLLGSGVFHPSRPTDIAGIGFMLGELVLAPFGVAIGASLAAHGATADFLDALAAAYQVRGLEAAILTGFELVAALVGSTPLALAGLIVLLASDYAALPMAASDALHVPPVPVLDGPVPGAEPPPSASRVSPGGAMALHF